MSFEEIIKTVDLIIEQDQKRCEVTNEIFVSYDGYKEDVFSKIYTHLRRERELLDKLQQLLIDERKHINKLTKSTEYLTTEQAVKHRNKTITKLKKHNKQLQTFCDAMLRIVSIYKINIKVIKDKNEEPVQHDPKEYLRKAREALRTHNEVVEELDTNMRIMNSYLL